MCQLTKTLAHFKDLKILGKKCLSIAIVAFTDSWKIARSIPILKSCKNDDRSSDELMSALLLVSRVVEKLM